MPSATGSLKHDQVRQLMRVSSFEAPEVRVGPSHGSLDHEMQRNRPVSLPVDGFQDL